LVVLGRRETSRRLSLPTAGSVDGARWIRSWVFDDYSVTVRLLMHTISRV